MILHSVLHSTYHRTDHTPGESGELYSVGPCQADIGDIFLCPHIPGSFSGSRQIGRLQGQDQTWPGGCHRHDDVPLSWILSTSWSPVWRLRPSVASGSCGCGTSSHWSDISVNNTCRRG